MKQDFKLKVFWTIIIFSIFLFYWLELRPSNIRRGCKQHIMDNQTTTISNVERELLGGDMNKINRAEREKSDFWYKDCLNSKGLKE